MQPGLCFRKILIFPWAVVSGIFLSGNPLISKGASVPELRLLLQPQSWLLSFGMALPPETTTPKTGLPALLILRTGLESHANPCCLLAEQIK